MTKSFLMGNQAFAHAALEAGVRVCAGYPGTPSSEVIETVAKLRDAGSAHDVYVEWSTNEKAALEMLAGAALCGARTLFTAKQVGLNVASDPLMSLNYIGVEGGTVLLVADDPGPISSQTEQDTRRFASFAKVPVFDPATPEQGCAMIAAAYDLSEKYHTPVIFRPSTRICHASTFVEVADEKASRAIPANGSSFLGVRIADTARSTSVYPRSQQISVLLRSIRGAKSPAPMKARRSASSQVAYRIPTPKKLLLRSKMR